MGELRVEISDTTTPTVIVLNGALDLDTARFLRDRFDLVVNSGVTDVVIDLRQVSFVDATGLGILLGGLRRLHEKGHVTVRSPPDEVRRFIDLTTFEGVVDIEGKRPSGPEASR